MSSCNPFSKDHIKHIAKEAGIGVKGVSDTELCNRVQARGLLPEIPPLQDDCKTKPLSRLVYQAKLEGIQEAGIYIDPTKQLLCDKISQKLRDRGEVVDEYASIPTLKPKESCPTSGVTDATIDYLSRKGIKENTLGREELVKVAGILGLKNTGKLDRNTLCHIIKKEIGRLDRGEKPNEPLQARSVKKVLHSTYDRVLIPNEENLSIPQLSRCLTSIDLTPQQILPAVVLSDPERNGIILAHNVGTGKTFAAINTSQVLLRRKIVDQVIVITPTSLQFNFMGQFKTYNKDLSTDVRYHYYTPVSFLNAMGKETVPMDSNTLLIIDEAHNYRTELKSSISIEKQRVDVAYSDISQGLKGRRVRAIFKFLEECRKIVKVLLLTATPLANDTSDLFNLVAMARRRDPEKFHISEEDEDRKDSMTYSGCDIHFYDTSERDKSLFPRTQKSTMYFEMSRDYYKSYFSIQVDEEQVGNLAVFYNGIRRASNKLDLVKSQKLTELVGDIRKKVRARPRVRILVYSSWIEAGLNSIADSMRESGIASSAITGRLSKMERQRAVNAFNEGGINVLLLSRAGGEGLDLKRTNIVYIVDPSWNEASVQQIIGRAVRRNSHAGLPPEEQVVEIYSMVLLKPFEGTILTERERRKDLYKKVFLDPEVAGYYPDEVLQEFGTDLNISRQMRKKDKKTGETVDVMDEMMSIDLYLYKFMKKKQTKINRELEVLRSRSSQCFDGVIASIEDELRDYVRPPLPYLIQEDIPASEEDVREAIKSLLGENTIIIEGRIEENQEYRKDSEVFLFRDIPLKIKDKGTAEFKALSDTAKLKLFVVIDKDANKNKVVLFYKNSKGKLSRENIIL
jgi:superfamily II DNA or RNA helicase